MTYDEVVSILGEPTTGKSSNAFFGFAMPYVWNGGNDEN